MLYIIAPMDENLVVSETHQVVKRNCFDLNELLQEFTIILFYFICIMFFSFILKYDGDYFNIALIDEKLVISETHQVVKRNCLHLNELLQECTIILFYFLQHLFFFFLLQHLFFIYPKICC